jgi:hypothetical protein
VYAFTDRQAYDAKEKVSISGLLREIVYSPEAPFNFLGLRVPVGYVFFSWKKNPFFFLMSNLIPRKKYFKSFPRFFRVVTKYGKYGIGLPSTRPGKKNPVPRGRGRCLLFFFPRARERKRRVVGG